MLSEEGPLTSKADIFSFGLTIWEMLALEAPHLPQFDENSTFDDSMQDSILYEDDTSNYGIFQSILNCCLLSNSYYIKYLTGTRPAIPEHIDEVKYKDILSLFYCMTVENPANRPSANQIILCIKDIKN